MQNNQKLIAGGVVVAVLVVILAGVVLLMRGSNAPVPDSPEDTAQTEQDSEVEGSPAVSITSANDAYSRENVQFMLDVLNLYSLDNMGSIPTAGGESLPTVTEDSLMVEGVDAQTLDEITPTYVTSIPEGVKVGVLENGLLIVGTQLSNGTIFSISQ